jgi:heterodisulfide reductase subunit A
MIPTASPSTFNLLPSSDGFISLPALNTSPSVTERPGIFVTGAAGGPMDIVDSIVAAGSAASAASAYIREKTGMPVAQQEVAYA